MLNWSWSYSSQSLGIRAIWFHIQVAVLLLVEKSCGSWASVAVKQAGTIMTLQQVNATEDWFFPLPPQCPQLDSELHSNAVSVRHAYAGQIPPIFIWYIWACFTAAVEHIFSQTIWSLKLKSKTKKKQQVAHFLLSSVILFWVIAVLEATDSVEVQTLVTMMGISAALAYLMLAANCLANLMNTNSLRLWIRVNTGFLN